MDKIPSIQEFPIRYLKHFIKPDPLIPEWQWNKWCHRIDIYNGKLQFHTHWFTDNEEVVFNEWMPRLESLLLKAKTTFEIEGEND